jgi:exodeoxyribonuclease VII large subunit
VEVIIIARGGGSVEDLLPFSDEQLVRAVSACDTPVVSAIGHEPDTPLLDLVADLRASTPTDAAKKVVPDVGEELERVRQLRERALRTVERLLDREAAGLAGYRARPALAAPTRMLDARDGEVGDLLDRSRRTLEHRLGRAHDDLAHLLLRVRALSPLATLRRGYAIVRRADGQVVRAVGDASLDDELDVRLADGALTVGVRGPVGQLN